jgi:hypothetical protein
MQRDASANKPQQRTFVDITHGSQTFSGYFVQHLASTAGGRQSYVNIYVVTSFLLAPCLFQCTGLMKVMGGVLGLEIIMGLVVGLPLGIRDVAIACDMHSSVPQPLHA